VLDNLPGRIDGKTMNRIRAVVERQLERAAVEGISAAPDAIGIRKQDRDSVARCALRTVGEVTRRDEDGPYFACERQT